MQYTVTMVVIDVSPSMGKERTIDLPPGPEGEPRTKTVTNLEWSLQFVLLKIQEMVRRSPSVSILIIRITRVYSQIFNGRKTDQCGVILFGTTSACGPHLIRTNATDGNLVQRPAIALTESAEATTTSRSIYR